MRIGIDLDGVVFDSEKEWRINQELYDIFDLKKNSKVDNKNISWKKRFNWTDEERKGFLEKYHKKMIEKSNLMPGAKRILKLLKEDGHDLILITARGGINKDMIKLTEDILKENDLDIFSKSYFGVKDKAEVCVKENIDIMIDDSYEHCSNIAKEKIKTIYLKDAATYDLEENEYIKVLYNWGEIYRYIREM